MLAVHLTKPDVCSTVRHGRSMAKEIFNHRFRLLDNPQDPVDPPGLFGELVERIYGPMPQDVNVRIPDHMIAPVRTIQNFPVSVSTVL
jgi:hypothetical protein